MTQGFSPFTQMADGTIKQINPFSGTEVWTVPGRGDRPLQGPQVEKNPIEPGEHACAFCWERKLETPPEKARMLADATVLRNVLADELDATVPEFRRIPNLFEIVTFDYWNANYGLEVDEELINRYMATGYEHVQSVVEAKTKKRFDGEELKAHARGFFSGGHDVIVARRHFVEGAKDSPQLASAGTLNADEHTRFIAFTVDAMEDLYAKNTYATYVVAFQNWLKPAGASFDHLHKQLVAIDDRGRTLRSLEKLVLDNPNIFNEKGLDVARREDLVIAENEHAVLFAGFGHRYPTLEVYSKNQGRPWEHTPEQIRGVSNLLHMAHRAIGADVPCNEEWHHQPTEVECAMPWRINLKLRVSTLAGFEGGTHIYLNTISPWDLRDKVRAALD
ncbi:DUF4921 family protein [Corynebacterium casei]|uniref:DUF4921 family protein n=1 Tax=Corynebacterium casei TaxID=160386 RepID=UPI001D02359A|nr:DUF4921 family protein [Corynebacterium casei]